ncbi:hypothetical protein Tco_0148706, partial [Tanacetum coccineum]
SDPSPRPSPTTHIPDSIPKVSGGNQGGTDQEAQEEGQTYYYTPQSLDEECILEAKIGREEILEVKLDAKGVYGTEDVVSTEDIVNTDRSKVSTDRSRKNNDKEKEGTDKEKEGTDKEKVSIVSPDEGTIDQTEGRSATPITPTTTPTMFGD